MKYLILVFCITCFSCEFTSRDYIKFGNIDFEDGEYEKAIEDYKKVQKTDSLYPEALALIKKTDSLISKKKSNDSINNRNELIKKQFSLWDGAHKNLEAAIKKSMNDPSSYQHVETTYRDLTNKLLINTTFRGSNKFGGIVTNNVKAYVDLNGVILEYLD